jgi:hypothetical protein
MKRYAKLLLINEIERCVKTRSGKIFDDVKFNLTYLDESFEDILSGYIIQKVS